MHRINNSLSDSISWAHFKNKNTHTKKKWITRAYVIFHKQIANWIHGVRPWGTIRFINSNGQHLIMDEQEKFTELETLICIINCVFRNCSAIWSPRSCRQPDTPSAHVSNVQVHVLYSSTQSFWNIYIRIFVGGLCAHCSSFNCKCCRNLLLLLLYNNTN